MKSNTAKDLINILATAKALEREAYHTYLNLALKTSSVSGKNLFIRLARDEAYHLETLEDLTEKLQLNDHVQIRNLPFDTVKMLAPNIKDTARFKADKALAGDSEILEIAMAHEIKAQNYYIEKAKEINSLPVRDLLMKLAEIEEGHYQILRAEFNKLQELGYWFDFPETSMESKIE